MRNYNTYNIDGYGRIPSWYDMTPSERIGVVIFSLMLVSIFIAAGAP